MKTLRIYIENSVIGGYFDDAFKESTQVLFNLLRDGQYIAVVSSHTFDELDNGAPDRVVENLKTIKYEAHIISDEMLRLTEKYMQEKIVSENYRSDALHIAAATVLKVDVLVSWNFKHIVNFDKIRLFNAVNLKEGFGLLEIRTPQEVGRNE